MYVLSDVEWMENQQGIISFTQIAMLRVDENWQPVRSIFRRIRPRDISFHQWDHIAFSGGCKESFIIAQNWTQAFEDIKGWLLPEDTICWWDAEARARIQKVGSFIDNLQIVLNERVAAFMNCGLSNPYHLGKSLMLQAPGPRHNSQNDVEMVRMLLEAIQFPNPVPEADEGTYAVKFVPPPSDYIAHVETNRIHKRGCLLIPAHGITNDYYDLTKPLRKNYVPCVCIKEEYYKARRVRTQGIIESTEYSFVYSPDSRIFHRRDCKLVLNAKQIMGTVRYRNCISAGRIPCKVCDPRREDENYKYVLSGKKCGKKSPEISLTKDVKRAVKRQRQAMEERMAYICNGALDREGKEDLYTLTQPRFAYWAATGYKTFHLRNCKKLSGLSDLEGFSLYGRAVAAGYRPCKNCKPNPKHDIHRSLPIYSMRQFGEGVDVLVSGCKSSNYAYRQEGIWFTIETPVGIWRINTAKLPYCLEHINKTVTPNNRVNFHQQPRMFHSLQDVIFYVKRHDDNILKREEKKLF